MELQKQKKNYVQPETVKHSSMNLVQGSHYDLYYTSLYYYHQHYYSHYYTTLYYTYYH